MTTNKNDYRDGFKDGFAAGLEEGKRLYNPWPSLPTLPNIPTTPWPEYPWTTYPQVTSVKASTLMETLGDQTKGVTAKVTPTYCWNGLGYELR